MQKITKPRVEAFAMNPTSELQKQKVIRLRHPPLVGCEYLKIDPEGKRIPVSFQIFVIELDLLNLGAV